MKIKLECIKDTNYKMKQEDIMTIPGYELYEDDSIIVSGLNNSNYIITETENDEYNAYIKLNDNCNILVDYTRNLINYETKVKHKVRNAFTRMEISENNIKNKYEIIIPSCYQYYFNTHMVNGIKVSTIHLYFLGVDLSFNDIDTKDIKIIDIPDNRKSISLLYEKKN